MNEEATLLERHAVLRHALVEHGLERAGLDGLALVRGDDELTTVEVVDGHLHAAQRLDEGNFLLDEQIIPLASERLVLLLLDDEDDVARNCVRRLVRFALEDNLLVVSHTLFDVNLEHLLLLDNLLRPAHVALVLFADRLT